MKFRVETYLRLKPPPAGCARPLEYSLEEPAPDAAAARATLHLTVPPDSPEGVIHAAHGAGELSYEFSGVLSPAASQVDTYAAAFRGKARGVLDGVNATLLAYGQTGSGKTHSMIGPHHLAGKRAGVRPKGPQARGVIPRALEEVFAEVRRREHGTPGSAPGEVRVRVSFFEIHNEKIYDLLQPKEQREEEQRGVNLDSTLEQRSPLRPRRGNKRPQVVLRDDGRGNKHLVGLRVYDAADEETAMRLLFTGCLNRETAQTPMNNTSSRSHAIFSVTVESTWQRGHRKVQRTGKLTFVDLAGSERLEKQGHYQSQGFGTLQRSGTGKDAASAIAEGRAINRSLAFLEQTVVALQAAERSGSDDDDDDDDDDDSEDDGDDGHGRSAGRSSSSKGSRRRRRGENHLPFRNSLLTQVLQDCLGHNSVSVFLATCMTEFRHIEETVSTMRFATRCARLETTVKVNSEVDPNEEIELLRVRLRRAKGQAKKRGAQVRSLKMQLGAAEEALTAWDDNTRRMLSAEEEARCSELVAAMLRKEAWSVDQLQTMSDVSVLRKLCEVMLEQAEFTADVASKAMNEAAVAEERIDALEKENKSLENRISMRTHRIVIGHGVHKEAALEGRRRSMDVGPEGDERGSRSSQRHSGRSNVGGALTLEADGIAKPVSSAEYPPSPTPENLTREQLMFIGSVGGLFTKHGRLGKPKIRYIWFSPDLRMVYWRGPDETTATANGHLDVAHFFNSVVTHECGDRRPKGYRKGARPEYCVALAGPKRNLRVEIMPTPEIIASGHELAVPPKDADDALLEALDMLRKSSPTTQRDIWAKIFNQALAEASP